MHGIALMVVLETCVTLTELHAHSSVEHPLAETFAFEMHFPSPPCSEPSGLGSPGTFLHRAHLAGC